MATKSVSSSSWLVALVRPGSDDEPERSARTSSLLGLHLLCYGVVVAVKREPGPLVGGRGLITTSLGKAFLLSLGEGD